MKRFLCVLLLLTITAIGAQQIMGAELLIKNGTILTVSHGTLEKTDLLVKDGKIAAIGNNLTGTANALIIDAGGKFVMPGIIDPHSHIGVASWPNLEVTEDLNEATDPITPQLRAEDSFNAADPAIKRAIAGGVTTIQTIPGSANLIGGQALVVKLKPNATMEEMKFQGAPKGMKMALGENPKMVYSAQGKMPTTRMGNFAALREWFTKGREYNQKWDKYSELNKKGKAEKKPERDLRLEAIGEMLKGEFLIHVHCYTRDEMLTMIAMADEFGFKIASFEHATEAYKIAETLAKRDISPCVWVDWWGFKMEALDAIPQGAGILANKGVRVAFHSDSADQIQRMNLMAAKAVRNGMDESKALEAITINPAYILGLDKRLGSIEIGKEADIAIFSGHPFNIYSRVDYTIIDGEIVYDRDKEPTMLGEKNAQ